MPPGFEAVELPVFVQAVSPTDRAAAGSENQRNRMAVDKENGTVWQSLIVRSGPLAPDPCRGLVFQRDGRTTAAGKTAGENARLPRGFPLPPAAGDGNPSGVRQGKGALAQLVERFVRNEEVRSSNLLCSTRFIKALSDLPLGAFSLVSAI